MASSGEDSDAQGLSPEDREWFSAVQAATSLADLLTLTDADTEHDAYLEAKQRWKTIQERRLKPVATGNGTGFPGDRVTIDGLTFVVHGITHANTPEERDFLHEHVDSFLSAGHEVYCEQGIWRMYFQDFPAVDEIDDYTWAVAQEDALEQTDVSSFSREFEGLTEEIAAVFAEFRDHTFSLIESGSDLYGDRFADALGDIASDFLLSHEEAATVEDFRSFRKSRAAARDPQLLGDLQRYYTIVLLPQPLEREWLMRHDPKLELFTHARNERLADYAVAHAQAETSHVIVGAAHQPGVVYYLDEYRRGNRGSGSFQLVE